MKTILLHNTDRGQIILLPDEFQFEDSEVYIRRDPNTGDVVLSRKIGSWDGFLKEAAQTEVPSDFMFNREQSEVARDLFAEWREDELPQINPDQESLANTMTFLYSPMLKALERFMQTSEFSWFRQEFVEGRLTFEEAVMAITNTVLSCIGKEHRTSKDGN
ncbi:hypothetical protein [Collimonas humicola]|uniref:antitoxin n=1 Tax=Collimonas humicola TaxID=2825886 RepID=UPI002E7882C4|nr:hypothetical protein [Collimonas humicola]